MKRSQLTVQWRDGLHIRPAARLVRLAQNFRSSIVLRANGRIADARSILSVMLLCAALGTVIDVEASGADEELALRAVENAFVSADDPTDDDSGRDLEVRGTRP
jgi:phosphotransferase system HPr (HPr) family protein